MLKFNKDSLPAWKMQVPMKDYATPPELIGADEYDMINIDPVVVYQVAATFMFILFAQVYVPSTVNDKRRKWCTINISNNQVSHSVMGWDVDVHLTPDLGLLY